VARALRLIAAGALDEGSVAEMATRLGVGDRHLRQLFTQHVGTSPLVVAQTRRLLFAKQLLDETTLSMTDIAMAAGFASIRRFNDVMQKTYGRSPSELRRQLVEKSVQKPAQNLVQNSCQDSGQNSGQNLTQHPAIAPITLKLPFSAPYDWNALVRFLAPRAIPGVEQVSLSGYRRAIAWDGQQGIIEVNPIPGAQCLQAQIWFPQVAKLAQIVERLRRLFDLGTPVAAIAEQLQHDPILRPLVAHRPGLRVPGAWDEFELAVRAILGQQVSVAAATTLAGRLVTAYGEPLAIAPSHAPDLRFVFPRPEVLAEADLTGLGLPKARAKAISALAAAVVQTPHLLTQVQTLDESIHTLCQLPGIGEWTAHYIAMRALREPDAFPTGDLGLLRAIAILGHPMTKAQLLDHAQAWRPWRAYAAMQLWSMEQAG